MIYIYVVLRYTKTDFIKCRISATSEPSVVEDEIVENLPISVAEPPSCASSTKVMS